MSTAAEARGLVLIDSAGLFPGSVLQIVEPLENLSTAIWHALVHDVAVNNTQLLPDSHLDVGPQLNGRTCIQI